MKKTFAVFASTVVLSFLVPIIGCSTPVDSQHPSQKCVEGIVERVEYTQTENGFMNPGHQNNHIYFSDGRSISLPGTLRAPKAIVVGKFNRIWFDDTSSYRNHTPWIRDVEILQQPETNSKQREPQLAHQRLAEFVNNESIRKALSFSQISKNKLCENKCFQLFFICICFRNNGEMRSNYFKYSAQNMYKLLCWVIQD